MADIPSGVVVNTTELQALVDVAVEELQGQIDDHGVDMALHSSGRELAYAERVASFQTTNNVEADITDCSITFTVTNRPVHISGFVTAPSNSVSGQNINLYITDAANVKSTGAADVWNANPANTIGTAMHVHERISTPGTYTRKLRFQSSSATAASGMVMVANIGKAYIMAIEA